jgi:hypothetical protein
MQIRIALIPLITLTFVLYSWELLDNVAIRILIFLAHLFLSIKSIYLKLYFENMLVKPKQCAISLRNFVLFAVFSVPSSNAWQQHLQRPEFLMMPRF